MRHVSADVTNQASNAIKYMKDCIRAHRSVPEHTSLNWTTYKTRLVPVHPELHGALNNALAYGDISQGRIIEAHPATAWRWVQAAVKRAEELGAIAPGKRVGTHTLRHSYARHLLMNGIPINYLSRWLGHSSIQTTLIYLELVPDPTGSLATIP